MAMISTLYMVGLFFFEISRVLTNYKETMNIRDSELFSHYREYGLHVIDGA